MSRKETLKYLNSLRRKSGNLKYRPVIEYRADAPPMGFTEGARKLMPQSALKQISDTAPFPGARHLK